MFKSFQDLLFDMEFLTDSIEPSVSWTNLFPMIEAIKHTWAAEMEKRKLLNLLAIRISQIYGDGVCVYLYYGIGPTKDKDQMVTYEEVTKILRTAIKHAGGSLSHHHGIGKKSSTGYAHAVSKVGIEMYKSIKERLDPNNVFDVGNLTEDKSGAKL